MKENSIRRAVREGRAALGTGLKEFASRGVPWIIEAAGFDYCAIDHEHGAFDMETIANMASWFQATNVSAIVRLHKSFAHLARCRPQHIQSSTPPDLPVDAEGLPSRSGGAVAECCRSSMKSACSRLTSACDRYRDKAEPRQRLRCASNVPRLQAADVHLATPVIKNQRATP